ncbi:MAG: hypothetical protein RL708_1976, partial [Bacteroidota bacterium]
MNEFEMINQLPENLLAELRLQQGFDEVAFLQAHQQSPNTSIRLNPKKKIAITPSPLERAGVRSIPWCNNGFYLEKRPSFTYDPLFHAGCYYVQEASSMFLEFVLKQTVDLSQSLKVLDLCAAPGGKSTLVASLINENSLLVSNEVIKNRATILKENISKWGSENVLVTNNDPKHFERLENYFDVLIIDAPCSGSGLFRKEPNYLNEWNENLVSLCNQRQQRIIADVWKCLKPNGVLIYSTCSFSESENEAIADWMIDEFEAENISIKIPTEFKIVETKSKKHQAQGFRFYPHLVQGEGFFCCAMRKKNDSLLQFTNPSPFGEGKGEVKKKKELQKRNQTKNNSTINKSILSNWLKNIDAYEFQQKNEFIIAQPKSLIDEMEFISGKLNVIKSGICIGQLTHKDLIPDHELAMSNLLS